MKPDSFPSDTAHTTSELPILQHGFELFARDGIKGFTVETLAKDLSMSKKTIYKFFPTKEILLQKIVQHVMALLAAHFTRVRGQNLNPLDKFITVMREITKTISRIPISRVNELKARYPSIWQEVENFRLARRTDFYQIMQEGRDLGLIRTDVNLEIAATLFMNIVNEVFQPEFFMVNQLSPSQVINAFRDIFLRGIVTREGLTYIEEKL